MSLINVRGYLGALAGALKNAMSRTGQDIPVLVQRRIYARRDPDGNTLRSNAPSTAAKKIRERGHAAPLIDKEVLTDPSRWDHRKRSGSVVVSLPASRRPSIAPLEILGYKVLSAKEKQLTDALTEHVRIAVKATDFQRFMR
jgi:hypothetical protein